MSGLDPSLILPQLVHRRATGAAGDAPFLAETGGPWHSYALIDDNARRLAGALVGMGVRRGDRVGVLLPTSVTSIVAWLACGWIGALEVPIHAEYRGAMLHHVLAHSGASVVLADAALLAAVFAIDGGLPGIDHLIVVPSIAGGPEEPPVEAPAHWRARMLAFDTLDSDPVAAESGPAYWDIASIVYTSGTTGPAKGVMVPWRQFYKHGEIVFPPKDVGPGDTFYCPLPLSHIAGRVGIYAMAMGGARAVLRPRFSLDAFWRDIADNACTCTILLGSIAEMLWRLPADPGDSSTPLVKVLMGPLIPQVEEFKRRFGVRVRTQFGMTETTAPLVSNIAGAWSLENDESCGRVLEGFHCRVADPQDEPLGPGEVGELLVRSDDPWMTMIGYWQDPESTARAFRNQWFHTGDAFRYDEAGNFYFVDRMNDTIRRRGENISSFVVEQAIAEHPAVADCAVVGVQSSFTEQEVHAFIVPCPGQTPDTSDISSFLRDKLPGFMVPRFWTLIDVLPRTATQRVRKVELRALAEVEHAHD